MKPLRLVTALLACMLTTVRADPPDAAAGGQLLDEHCYACHGDEVYTRPDRRFNTRSSLATQVQRCQLAQNLQWFDEDVENVTEYLSDRFYHFGK
ncbi:MAG: cytochrome c [Candidatus Sedimenticola endophacoides]